jgi:hypothetical protein
LTGRACGSRHCGAPRRAAHRVGHRDPPKEGPFLAVNHTPNPPYTAATLKKSSALLGGFTPYCSPPLSNRASDDVTTRRRPLPPSLRVAIPGRGSWRTCMHLLSTCAGGWTRWQARWAASPVDLIQDATVRRGLHVAKVSDPFVRGSKPRR